MKRQFKRNLRKVFLPMILLLAGCANSSSELRTKPHQEGATTIKLPYLIVFDNITNSARKCFPERGTFLSAFFATSSEIEDGKLGRIEVINAHGGGVKDVLASIDVRSDPNDTKVSYYISWRYFGTYDDTSNFKPIVEAWAAGNSEKCS